jgi:hypothetical protein
MLLIPHPLIEDAHPHRYGALFESNGIRVNTRSLDITSASRAIVCISFSALCRLSCPWASVPVAMSSMSSASRSCDDVCIAVSPQTCRRARRPALKRGADLSLIQSKLTLEDYLFAAAERPKRRRRVLAVPAAWVRSRSPTGPNVRSNRREAHPSEVF